MTFTDTATYQRVSALNAAMQYQFDAALEREVREVQQPWPAIDTVSEVSFRADLTNPNNVVIDVTDGQGYITTRVRDAQAAIVEAAGYAMRAGWNYSPVLPLPEAFVNGFLAVTETMPAEVTK